MTTSTVEAESVLAIDLGTIHTRALLFDVVDGQYRFIGSGVAHSTVNAPFRDAREGVSSAVEVLQEKVGRTLVKDGHIPVPTQPDGSGIDRLVLTFSAGPELRIVTAGLLGDVSLQSAQRLAATLNGVVVENIGLTDRRRTESQVDAILQVEPNLVILAGGTERGASRSVIKLAELFFNVCRILPQESRPLILYAGNSLLAKKIQEGLSKWTTTRIAPNIRPSIDLEDLAPAQEVLSEVVAEIRERQIGGLQILAEQCSTPPIPAPHAMGRMVQFLSQVYDPVKGVLAIDLGSRNTTVAHARQGRLTLNVAPFGMGSTINKLLEVAGSKKINQWLSIDMPADSLRDYLWQKSINPQSIPANPDTLAIEQAAARAALNTALGETRALSAEIGSSFDPILFSGSLASNAPSAGQSLLLLLDGIQPVGISTIILDNNGLLPALGAISKINPILPVQALESRAILNLGTVICPLIRAKPGTPIMMVRVEYEKGNETQVEIRQGALTVLPVRHGQSVTLHLEPLRRMVIDTRSSPGLQSVKIIGGVCGAVVDGRGRPLILPADDAKRRELILNWKAALGS